MYATYIDRRKVTSSGVFWRFGGCCLRRDAVGRAAAGLTSEVDGPACRHCYKGQNTRGHDTLMDVVAHPAEQPQERPSKGGR